MDGLVVSWNMSLNEQDVLIFDDLGAYWEPTAQSAPNNIIYEEYDPRIITS